MILPDFPRFLLRDPLIGRMLGLRTMPKPVRELLRLVHIEGIELSKARGEDFEVVSYLKQANPRLYRNLRKEAHRRNTRKK